MFWSAIGEICCAAALSVSSNELLVVNVRSGATCSPLRQAVGDLQHVVIRETELYNPFVRITWSILNISLMPVVPLPDSAPCVKDIHLFRSAVPRGNGEVVVNASLLPPVSLRVSPAISPEK